VAPGFNPSGGPAGADAERRTRQAARLDRALHLLGLAASAVGGVVLLAVAASAPGGRMLTGAAVYLASLIGMLVCSLLYNSATPGPRRAFLRRVDHAAIFVLIAGTYTPFMIGALDHPTIRAALAGVWVAAFAGAVIEVIQPGRHRWLSIALYLAVGWSGIVVIGPLAERVPSDAMVLIVLGALTYSAGVAVYMIKAWPWSRAAWHGFVLLAAALHFMAVFRQISAVS
jgi:hemolysin III